MQFGIGIAAGSLRQPGHTAVKMPCAERQPVARRPYSCIIYIYLYIYICIYIYIHVHMCMCLYMCIHIKMRMCVYIYLPFRVLGALPHSCRVLQGHGGQARRGAAGGHRGGIPQEAGRPARRDPPVRCPLACSPLLNRIVEPR